MRWLKHLTAAHQDIAMSEILEEFGPEGYGIYWLLLEHLAVAVEKDSLAVPTAAHSVIRWSQICHCSARLFRKFTTSAAHLRLISVTSTADLRQISAKSMGDRLQISIPKLLKYRDEYSKKSGQTPDKLRTNSALDRDRDTEGEHKQIAPVGAETPATVSEPKTTAPENRVAAIDQPRWKTDPDYRLFREAAAAFWPDLIDNDLEQGYGFWRVMDWEERKRVVDGIEARKKAGIDSQFVCKPEKFLRTKEFNRPIKARDSPKTAEQEKAEILRLLHERKAKREERASQ